MGTSNESDEIRLEWREAIHGEWQKSGRHFVGIHAIETWCRVARDYRTVDRRGKPVSIWYAADFRREQDEATARAAEPSPQPIRRSGCERPEWCGLGAEDPRVPAHYPRGRRIFGGGDPVPFGDWDYFIHNKPAYCSQVCYDAAKATSLAEAPKGKRVLAKGWCRYRTDEFRCNRCETKISYSTHDGRCLQSCEAHAEEMGVFADQKPAAPAPVAKVESPEARCNRMSRGVTGEAGEGPRCSVACYSAGRHVEAKAKKQRGPWRQPAEIRGTLALKPSAVLQLTHDQPGNRSLRGGSVLERANAHLVPRWSSPPYTRPEVTATVGVLGDWAMDCEGREVK